MKLPLLKSTEISRETSGKFPEVSTRTFKNFQEISTVVLQLPAGAKEVTQVTQGAGELTSAQRVIVALGLVVPASPRWQGCSRSVHGGEKIIVLAERVLKLQDSTTTAGSTEAATPNTVKATFFPRHSQPCATVAVRGHGLALHRMSGGPMPMPCQWLFACPHARAVR